MEETTRNDVRVLPPMFKAYSPRHDFDPKNPTTHGCAIQFDFRKNTSTGIASIMLKVGRQITPTTGEGEATFDWDHERLYTKLTVWEIGHILTVLNERRQSAKFLNKSHEGDITIMIESTTDGDDMGATRFMFVPATGAPMSAVLQPYQTEPLRVFLESAIDRILYARA